MTSVVGIGTDPPGEADPKNQMGSLSGKTICYVSTDAFSGVTRTMKQARTVSDAGVQVCFVGYDEYLPDSVRDSGFRVVSVPFGVVPRSTSRIPAVSKAYDATIRRARNLLRRVLAPYGLVRAIVSTGADVVQSVDLPALRCSSLAADRLHAVLSFDSHEMWTGFLDNPELKVTGLDRRRLLHMEKRYAPRANVVFVVSDEMGRRMSHRYRLRSTITVLNSPPGYVTSSSQTKAPVRLVFHGSLSATKNVEGLLRAMSRLKGKATLDIHGAGLTLGEDYLARLVRENDLEGVVTIHGKFCYQDVLTMLAPYDVGVYAAKMIEDNFAISLPNKLFDCICAGLAVAASDFPAIRELLEGCGCGVCLDPTSTDTIASGLSALVDDPERIDAMKKHSLDLAPRIAWEVQGQRIVECFVSLLAGAHPAPRQYHVLNR